MKTLHVTPYFAPAFRYGGPPRSILGLCRGLRSAGVDAEVLTTTADGALEVPNDVVHRGEYEGVPVRYLRVSFPRRYFNAAGLSRALRETLPSVDLVHVHGLWSFPAWIATRECRLAHVPFVVSPRGMLDGGSMAHHRWRKELGYWLRERSYLQKAALLHATSCVEEDKLSQLALGPRIVCLPNGVAVPTQPPPPRFRDRLGIGANDRLVVFLGRLHPIKRLDLALAAFERVRAAIPGVRLVLAGPPDGIDPHTLVREASDPSSVISIGEVGWR